MKEYKVGGVALFDGIQFTSQSRQAQVRNQNGHINCKVENLVEAKNIVAKIPIIRAIFGIGGQLDGAATTFIKSSGETNVKKVNAKFTYMLFIALCITIPILLSIFFNSSYRIMVQFGILLIEFLIYIISLKGIKELDTLYMYHGAEHKVVNAYENLDKAEFTFENVKKQSRFHKRCGGNFVIYFMILTLLSVFIPIENIILKEIVLILICILNIGIAYEIVNLFSKLKAPFDILNYPATMIQFITTKEPTDDMIKLAMYGVKAVTRDEDITVMQYINQYLAQNTSITDYDIQDIYSIIAYELKTDRNKVFLNKDEIKLKINQEIKLDELLAKYYNEKYPLQYITHKQFFYNEVYYVNEDVLIPRQDSEILVEKALDYIEKENISNIIDLCTGSGCIGISIAKNAKSSPQVLLLDISPKAITVAKRNIVNNKCGDNIIAKVSDLLKIKLNEIEKLDNVDEYKVDMIVSNPPYIKTDVLQTLQQEVKKEPIIALDGGKDGLKYYIRIIEQAKKVLKNNGLLIFEIGYDELESIKNIIAKNPEYMFIESVKDYGGNDRVVVCRFQVR